MIYLIVLLVVCAVIAIIAHLAQRKSEVKPIADQQPSCDTCNGNNEQCLHDCILEAAVNAPEYFDDEELDAFKGRSEDSYDDDEIEQFREVMLTMQTTEVALWTQSLNQRGISLPTQLRDEAIMLING